MFNQFKMENQPAPIIFNLEETQERSNGDKTGLNIINNKNDFSNYKDKNFNKLRNLQKLIRKESALKELCKFKNKID